MFKKRIFADTEQYQINLKTVNLVIDQNGSTEKEEQRSVKFKNEQNRGIVAPMYSTVIVKTSSCLSIYS